MDPSSASVHSDYFAGGDVAKRGGAPSGDVAGSGGEWMASMAHDLLQATDAVEATRRERVEDGWEVVDSRAVDALQLKRTEFVVRGTRRLVVYETADQDRTTAACMLDGEEPFGSVTWPAAFAAATALVRIAKARGSLRGLTILELGAGTGLVSLVAHAWGAKAVATDNTEVSLRVLRASRAELSDAKRFVVCALDFSKEADVAAAVRRLGPFDVVVAAATLYVPGLARATARAVVASRATARLVVDPTPVGRAAFIEELRADAEFQEAMVESSAVRVAGRDESYSCPYDGAYARGFEDLNAPEGCCVA